MTDWKKVQGSQAEKPAEFDTTTSEVVVYQRRNIERVTVKNTDNTETELWEGSLELSGEESILLTSLTAGPGMEPGAEAEPAVSEETAVQEPAAAEAAAEEAHETKEKAA